MFKSLSMIELRTAVAILGQWLFFGVAEIMNYRD